VSLITLKSVKTMRKRINKSIFAGSSDKQKVIEWKKELEENHVRNSSLFMTINQTITLKPKTNLELFEERLKANIAEFKARNHNNITNIKHCVNKAFQ
jgi:hypothetical protein